MRLIAFTVLLSMCFSLEADDKATGELERVRQELATARTLAAAEPAIKDATSPPVRAYLAEQKRRRLTSLVGLRERVEQYQADSAKQSLVPVLKEQLAELEIKPLEPVSFDGAYDYAPSTGLVGYSKRVRLIENTSDGQSIILVDGNALVLSGLGTSQYPSGKFLYMEKAILVGSLAPFKNTYQGTERKVFTASLVDLEDVLKGAKKHD